MPQINRQTNRQVSTPTTQKTKTTNLLSQAIDVADLGEEHIKLTLYGLNRVGKTSLACQFPKPLLLLSFEPNKSGGARSVTAIPGVRLFKITSSADALRLADELDKDNEYKSVVVDSATSYQDLFLKEILGLSTLPEQLSFGTVSGEQYRQRSEKVKEGLRPFLNLEKHVIITAKEKDHNPPKEERTTSSGKTQPDMRPKFIRGMQQESFVASDLGGAAVSWLHDACDYIGRLYLAKEVITTKSIRKIGNRDIESETEEETGRITHRVRTMYHPNFAAGFRSPNPESIPEYVEGHTPEKLYAELIRVITGKK